MSTIYEVEREFKAAFPQAVVSHEENKYGQIRFSCKSITTTCWETDDLSLVIARVPDFISEPMIRDHRRALVMNNKIAIDMFEILEDLLKEELGDPLELMRMMHKLRGAVARFRGAMGKF